jgi:non-specific protein-tyrosine kinase
MAEPVAELQLSDYLDIARRRKWIIAAIVVLALAAAILSSALQTPQYRAQARVRVESSSTNILDDATNLSSNVRDRNLQNEVEFANSDRVRERASSTFGEIISAGVAASGSSDTLTFSAVDEDPERAAAVANTVANSYVSERSVVSGERFLSAVNVINERLAEISEERLFLERELLSTSDESSVSIQIATLDAEESRLRAQLNEVDVVSQINQGASVAILNAAEAPGSPFAPSWIRNIALALVAGLILGVGAALLRETLDDTIVNKRDFERAADGTPVLGVIPRPWNGRRRTKQRRLIASRTGAFTESFRSLRSAIELGQASGGEIRSILVTSANPSEGKSTVAAHLALSFARAGANVLVIDADMHNPTQHEMFGVENINGLAEHLANIGEAEIVTEQGSGEGLISLIPAGTSASPPAELLSSMAAHEFIQKLSFAYDLVIVDSPPLRPVADTLPLARIVDGTLLVGMRGQTNAKEVDQAMELLARAQARPLGAVLNGADEADGGYGYGYGYGYGAKKR